MKNISGGILHIDSEKSWRGGQQQVIYLHEGLLERGYKSKIVCQPGSALEDYCRRKILPHFSIKMRGELGIFAARRIAKLCKQEDFGILHLHSAHALATGLWVKLFNRNLCLIGTRRVSAKIKQNPFSKFKYTSRMVNRHVCISNNIKQVMISDGVPEGKLVVIHSGIDLKKFDNDFPMSDFKKTIGIPEDNLVVGTIASMSKDKNYPNLLSAAKKVLQRCENVTFCAVGAGPDEVKIRDFARTLGIENDFIFTGYRKDIGNFLKIFDIFVLASSFEGLGTSLLDAQTCGLPLIGSDVGGIPEVIEHTVNGYLVPPENSDALADAIIELLQNNEKRASFGDAGKSSVARFDIEKTIDNNIELYHQINNHGNQIK